MREYVTLECGECKSQNYRTSTKREDRKKLVLMKHCPKCRKHTEHQQRRK